MRYLLRRLLLTVPVLIGVLTLVFALIHLIPGDPVQAMLGETAAPKDVEDLRHRLGLDAPLATQYGRFMAGVARGDLGRSLRTGQPVVASIAERMPATAELSIAAVMIAVLLAIPLGVIAAVKRGTWVDHAAMGAALAGVSIPGFWLGPLLALVFSVQFGSIRTNARLEQVERTGDQPPIARMRDITILVSTPPDVGMSIEVRGQRLDEALPKVEEFLDHASRNGRGRVLLIHGKGTGAMRRAVRELLDRHPLVTSYETADRTEGGDGVTVAFLETV